jgi:lipopolysaccharide export system permease protein
LLALLTVPLSRSKPRQGRYARLLLAFVIYALYYNLIEVSQTWVKQQKASTIWWAPLLLLALAILAYLPWGQLKYALRGRKA